MGKHDYSKMTHAEISTLANQEKAADILHYREALLMIAQIMERGQYWSDEEKVDRIISWARDALDNQPSKGSEGSNG